MVRFDKMNKKHRGFRIQGLRKEKGLSQQELAKILDIDCSTLKKIENGEEDPTLKTFIKIGNYFSVDFDWLMTGEGFKQIELCNKIDHMLNDMKRRPNIRDSILKVYFYWKRKLYH